MSDRAKVVMVTGSAGGIGRAVVRLFNAKGWLVIGTDLQDFGPDFPEDGAFFQADITNPIAMEDIFEKVCEFTSTLDALVNNVAIQIAKPILEMSVEEWDMSINANLRSAFLASKLAHPLLKAASGAIVNVSSIHALATSANIAAYAASKGGLLALTRAMAVEFAPDNIRANAILPGAVDTPMLRGSMQRDSFNGDSIQQRLDNLASRTVNGRIAQPDEIAQSIYFLADNTQSSFMTGQALVVDGGATARLSTE